MAVISNGLQHSLSAKFGIPTDIKFLFTRKEVDGSTITEEIRAHKHILALASDVFKKGFYGGMKDNGSIEITDVTKEAFEVMINAIYDKETNMRNHDFDMLCTIYYLADKYNITALEKETLEAIKTKDIPVENIIDVGILAIQHEVHDTLAEALLEASAQRLSRIFKGNLNNALDYLSEMDTDDSLDIIKYKSLMKIMATLRNINVCVNCKVSPCIKGVKLSRDNFVPRSKIVPHPGALIVNTSIDHCAQLGTGSRFLGVLKSGETRVCRLEDYAFNC